MPKQKTHKATKKRFRVTASGKVKSQSAFTRHRMTRRTAKRKRNLRGTSVIEGVETAKIVTLLNGYSY